MEAKPRSFAFDETANRRYESRENVTLGWDVMWRMGIPILYVCALLMGLVGVACLGIVTHYWADLSPPICFLYWPTGMGQIGGPLINCQWATWGGVTGVSFILICGGLYIIKARSKGGEGIAFKGVLAGMVVACVMMLAVSCTMSEGMRITCASFSLNSVNNRGTNCYEKLEEYVQGHVIPVSSSAMIRAGLYTYWGCTVFTFIVTCFHLTKFYRANY